jgi:hypothetical protein
VGVSEQTGTRVSSRPRYERDEAEFDRAVAFFDATYALALTLLVNARRWRQSGILADLGALDDAVGSQFVTPPSPRSTAADRAQPRSGSGRHPDPVRNGGGGRRVRGRLAAADAVYAVNIACAYILTVVVYVAARRRDLPRHADDPSTARALVVNGLLPATVFLCLIPIAYYGSPEAARWSWLSLVVPAHLTSRLSRAPRGSG